MMDKITCPNCGVFGEINAGDEGYLLYCPMCAKRMAKYIGYRNKDFFLLHGLKLDYNRTLKVEGTQ